MMKKFRIQILIITIRITIKINNNNNNPKIIKMTKKALKDKIVLNKRIYQTSSRF